MHIFCPLVRGWWAMILALVQEKSRTTEKMNLDALLVLFTSLDTSGPGNTVIDGFVVKPIQPIYYLSIYTS